MEEKLQMKLIYIHPGYLKAEHPELDNPKAAEPVLVPDDEDLIDDNNWETGVPSVHGSTQPHNVATGRSGPSVLPLLTKMLLTLLSLVSCSLFVWYWGGGRVQIGKMIANKEVGRPKGT